MTIDGDLDAHPLADLFPMMDDAAFTDLATDIQEHGLREPIVLLDGQILDGRNRWKACKRHKIEPVFVQYEGDDPASYVISLNLRRRHLNESQRAMVAERLANISHGGDRRSDQAANLPLVQQSEAAAKLSISERALRSAKTVRTKGVAELATAVEDGRASVSAAEQIARQPRPVQQAIIEHRADELSRAAKELVEAKRDNEQSRSEKAERPQTVVSMERARNERLFGTPASRALVMQIFEIAETVSGLPSPADLLDQIPPAFRDRLTAEEIAHVPEWFGTLHHLLTAKEQKNVSSQ